MPHNFKDVVDSKKLPTGAKIIYFSDGRYKFIPSETYRNQKEKCRFKKAIKETDISNTTQKHCEVLIDNIFKVLLKTQ